MKEVNDIMSWAFSDQMFLIDFLPRACTDGAKKKIYHLLHVVSIKEAVRIETQSSPAAVDGGQNLGKKKPLGYKKKCKIQA